MISHSMGLVKIRDINYIPTMGRKRINDEQTPARFPAGTLERIDAVLDDGEKRSDLIREAVERELNRRERQS
jgi:hypothetical protein